jgi:bifunctional enzyme CysN/CysC
MVHLGEEPIATDVAAYLEAHERQDMLRFITCGSVDDGKSTLIGRLLYESHLVFEDHLAQLERDSRRFGTHGGELDLALLVDGLAAEREQGITIDVAHRFFSTERRTFIVADTPGHEQYTRNMVTGASTADLAVLLVDARKGVVTQTRRHSHIVSLLGIRHLVLAVNKLDLVDYAQDVFERIADDYRTFAAGIGFDGDITCIPLSALRGDNVTGPSPNTPWYRGPSLVEHLGQVEVHDAERHGAFRMPVQWVNRPDPDFRGVAGMITAGSVRIGDAVRVLPAGTATHVARIVTFDGDLDEAIAGQSVTLVLADEVDVSRGNLLCAADRPAEVADQFEAHIVWMDEAAMHPGRQYLLQSGPLTAGLTISQPKYKVDVNSLEHLAAKTLELNEIGVCTISTDPPIPFDPYAVARDTGGFVVVDKQTNATCAAGLLHFALRRATNVHLQALDVTPEARSSLKGHRPGVVWLTGLSGAGKSTIANRLEQQLLARSVHTFLLDGDNVRHGLNRDLGFTEADRIENVRRVTEVARLMVDAGLVVLVSFISPFRAERELARRLIGDERFCEVHVDVPLEVAEARDPKGLYAKARSGLLPNFTGVDSPYEPPAAPEVRIDTTVTDPAAAAASITERLQSMGLIGP